LLRFMARGVPKPPMPLARVMMSGSRSMPSKLK
jgi:hypothetical protein